MMRTSTARIGPRNVARVWSASSVDGSASTAAPHVTRRTLLQCRRGERSCTDVPSLCAGGPRALPLAVIAACAPTTRTLAEHEDPP
jgi:hypothetical protein